jgi:hypothetical protein
MCLVKKIIIGMTNFHIVVKKALQFLLSMYIQYTLGKLYQAGRLMLLMLSM